MKPEKWCILLGVVFSMGFSMAKQAGDSTFRHVGGYGRASKVVNQLGPTCTVVRWYARALRMKWQH